MRTTVPGVTALVPMRHQSERVPGKNYRSFCGRPLFHHIIESLLACPPITMVVVDTDSPVVKRGIADFFPQVRLIDRPEALRSGDVPMNDVLLHDVSRLESSFFLQTHSTNPLLRPETLTASIARFMDHYPDYDSLFSVTNVQARFWDAMGRPINHDPEILLRTQDLPPLYLENSCIYIFSRSVFEERHNRIGERPLMFEIDAAEAWDIDEELDFRIAEMLYRSRDRRVP